MKIIPIKNMANVADDLLFRKINFISSLLFKELSPKEAQILEQLVRIGNSGMVNLTIDTSKLITNLLSMNDNTLNVSLARMEGKGVIKKNKRLVSIHPAFGDIMNENEYLVKFKHGN